MKSFRETTNPNGTGWVHIQTISLTEYSVSVFAIDGYGAYDYEVVDLESKQIIEKSNNEFSGAGYALHSGLNRAYDLEGWKHS